MFALDKLAAVGRKENSDSPVVVLVPNSRVGDVLGQAHSLHELPVFLRDFGKTLIDPTSRRRWILVHCDVTGDNVLIFSVWADLVRQQGLELLALPPVEGRDEAFQTIFAAVEAAPFDELSSLLWTLTNQNKEREAAERARRLASRASSRAEAAADGVPKMEVGVSGSEPPTGGAYSVNDPIDEGETDHGGE